MRIYVLSTGGHAAEASGFPTKPAIEYVYILIYIYTHICIYVYTNMRIYVPSTGGHAAEASGFPRKPSCFAGKRERPVQGAGAGAGGGAGGGCLAAV